MPTRQLKQDTIRSLLREAEAALLNGPHAEKARLDAEALLLHVVKAADAGRGRAWLMAHANESSTHGNALRALVERRLRGEPIQYITGEVEFYGLPLRVTPDVLIPRPETEHLVEKALRVATSSYGIAANSLSLVTGHDFSRAQDAAGEDGALLPASAAFPRILDVGTGSGAIAIALAHNLAHAQVTAVDISTQALKIARENAEHNAVADRIRLLQGDLLEPVAGEHFELVVSNPPYVPTSDKATLAVEVREYEPALALFAGDDGLDIYRRLIPAAHAALVPGGCLLLEIGYGQSTAIEALLRQSGFEAVEFIADLQGISRVACGRRPWESDATPR